MSNSYDEARVALLGVGLSAQEAVEALRELAQSLGAKPSKPIIVVNSEAMLSQLKLAMDATNLSTEVHILKNMAPLTVGDPFIHKDMHLQFRAERGMGRAGKSKSDRKRNRKNRWR